MNLYRLVTPHTTLIYATTHSLNLNQKKRAVVTQPRVKLCAATHLLIIHMTLCYIHQCCPLSLMFSDKYQWLNIRSRCLMLRQNINNRFPTARSVGREYSERNPSCNHSSSFAQSHFRTTRFKEKSFIASIGKWFVVINFPWCVGLW